MPSPSTYAFPSYVVNDLGHYSYTQYDYYLGKPVDAEDVNNVTSSLYYNDLLDRPTKGIKAVGVATVKAQTNITYDDTNRVITVASDKDTYAESANTTPGGLVSKAYYDGLGRTWRKAGSEGSGNWAITDTQFDALGRTWRVSNPYRATSLTGAVNPSGLWTTTTFDALGEPCRCRRPTVRQWRLPTAAIR